MTSKLVITSDDRELEVGFEPLGEFFNLPPKSRMTVTLEGGAKFDEDRLEINYADGSLVFWVFGESRDVPEKLVEVTPRWSAKEKPDV